MRARFVAVTVARYRDDYFTALPLFVAATDIRQ